MGFDFRVHGFGFRAFRGLGFRFFLSSFLMSARQSASTKAIRPGDPGFRVQGLGFRVSILGFMVSDLGCGVAGLSCVLWLFGLA